MPKLSVIIPVYNTKNYIEKCLNSLINQTFKDIELIIVNDGSSDDSNTIIKQFITKHPNENIKYYEKENGGLSDARNYGVAKATGKYISFVDSDDWISKNLYKNLEKYMDNNIDLIKFKMITVDENGKEIEKLDGPVFEKLTGENAFEKLCTKDKYLEVACTYLYRRDFFIENKFKYKIGAYHEDFGLTPLVIVQAKTVVSTNNFGYYYLQRNNSITSREDVKKELKKAYDVLEHYDSAIEKIEKLQISNKTKALIKRYYANSLILKSNGINGKDREEFIKKIKERKVYKNIKANNLKQLLKKIILKFNINLYLKMR